MDQIVLAVNAAVFHAVAMKNPTLGQTELVKPENMPTGYTDGWTTALMNAGLVFEYRHEIKGDLNYRKVLPYVTFVRVKDGQKQVLIYDRTKSGDQQSLWEKISLGYGGHIEPKDSSPNIDAIPCHWNSFDVSDTIKANINREIKEETGFLLNESHLSPRRSTFAGFLITGSADMKQTEMEYLGLSFVIVAPDDFEPAATEDACDRHRWISVNELYESNDFAKLELWSKTVLRKLARS